MLTLRERLRGLSLLYLIASAFFWGWAVLNCVTKGFDLGAFSFLTTFAAGFLAFRVQQSPTYYGADYAGYAVRISSLFVSINYIMGIVFVHRIGFQIYCGVAAILWALSGWMFTRDLWVADESSVPSDAPFVAE